MFGKGNVSTNEEHKDRRESKVITARDSESAG
jgi:hypothetical protein